GTAPAEEPARGGASLARLSREGRKEVGESTDGGTAPPESRWTAPAPCRKVTASTSRRDLSDDVLDLQHLRRGARDAPGRVRHLRRRAAVGARRRPALDHARRAGRPGAAHRG